MSYHEKENGRYIFEIELIKTIETQNNKLKKIFL